MRKYYIIHNKNDANSKAFVEANPGYKVIDFYDYENEQTKLFANLEIPVSSLPTVVEVNLKLLSVNPASIASAITEIKATKEYKIARAIEDMDFGKKIIAEVRVSSIERELSEAQTNAMESSMVSIISKLDLGKITQAQTLISKIAPDGTVVTQKLKDYILGKISQYLLEG